jgi:hypothetical protein
MAQGNAYSNLVTVNSIVLTNYNGVTFSIIDLVQRIEFYESVFLNNVYGFIEILDSTDMPQTVPLIGEESITFKISLPGYDVSDNFVFENFKIYKMTDRFIRDDKIQSYKLWFISEEAITNLETKISKIWKQETTDQIVRSVFYKLNSDKEDTLNVEQTIGIQNYVATNISPFEIINYLAANRSINNKKLSDFLFFESLDTTTDTNEKGTTYNFASLNSLCSSDSVMDITFHPVNIKVDDDIHTYKNNVEDIEFSKSFNVLESKISGLYNQSIIYYDILRKKHVVQKNKYEDIFNESGRYRLDGDDSNKLFVNNSNTPSEFVKLLHVSGFPGNISSTKEISNTNNKSIEKKRGRSRNKWIEKYGSKEDKVSSLLEETYYRRRVLLHEFEVNKIYLNNLSGNYNLSIGKTINFKKPHIRINKSELENNTGSQYDKYISGKYLIIGSNHVIKLSDNMNWEYKTHLEVSKNSVKSNYEGT